jgi:hypothetical protein
VVCDASLSIHLNFSRLQPDFGLGFSQFLGAEAVEKPG